MDRDPEQAAALQAIARALASDQAATLRREAARRWPHLDGTGVSGTLGWIGDHGVVDTVAVLYAAHEDELPAAPGTAYAAYTLALTGQELTAASVTQFLERAGLTPDDGPAGHAAAWHILAGQNDQDAT